MVLNERELRAVSGPQHLVAILEKKRRRQLAKRTSLHLVDADLAALVPRSENLSTGRRAIERAYRDARSAAMSDVLEAANALPAGDDAAARVQAQQAVGALRLEVQRRAEDPDDDPLWFATRKVLVDFAAALVPLVEHSFETEIDVAKTVRFEVEHTAPQRLGAHMGSQLWDLLIEHFFDAAMEDGLWRPRRSVYALLAMVIEEICAIDDLDPADVFDLHEHDGSDQYY